MMSSSPHLFQREVDEDEIGLCLGDVLKGSRGRAGLAADLQGHLRVQECCQSMTHNRVVFHEKYLIGHRFVCIHSITGGAMTP